MALPPPPDTPSEDHKIKSPLHIHGTEKLNTPGNNVKIIQDSQENQTPNRGQPLKNFKMHPLYDNKKETMRPNDKHDPKEHIYSVDKPNLKSPTEKVQPTENQDKQKNQYLKDNPRKLQRSLQTI